MGAFFCLIDEEKVSRAYLDQAISAIKFLYGRVLSLPKTVGQLPRPRRERKPPVILSRQEVLRLLAAVTNPNVADRYLKRWYFWATHTRLAPVIEAAKAIKRHWAGVLAFIRSWVTNGVVEGLTSKIKTALKRAYSFKTFENYRTIVYLITGELELSTQC